MKAKSIKGTTVSQIKAALTDSMEDGFHPSLAIIYVSISRDTKEICTLFDQLGISVFGATTNGEFIDEDLGKDSAAILLLQLDKSAFRVYLEDYPDMDCRRAANLIAQKASKDFQSVAFLIAGSHLEANAEEMLHGFEDVIGPDVNIFGCMAGDDFAFTEQYVFANEKMTNQGLVVLALDAEKVSVSGRALCGWKPMGTEKTVTKSEGNRVYTINDIPALDITAKYGGITNLSEENNNLLTEIATNCTIQLQRENGPPVMRPGLRVNWDDHSFICSGSVPQGSKIKFSLPPDFDAIEEVVEGCKEMKEESPVIDALIYITCAGRLIAFGPLMSKEIGGIKEVWDVPMVGMFSNAELGRAKEGDLEMHNLSSCIITLREK